jgi:hypothetical protein
MRMFQSEYVFSNIFKYILKFWKPWPESCSGGSVMCSKHLHWSLRYSLPMG